MLGLAGVPKVPALPAALAPGWQGQHGNAEKGLECTGVVRCQFEMSPIDL